MAKSSMNVSLTPRLYEFVKQLINSGKYETQSEVIREALRLLAQKENDIPRATITPKGSLPPFDYLGMEDDFP